MKKRNNEEGRKKIDGKKLKIGIVAADFNWDIVGGMLEGSLDILKKNGVSSENIDVVKVPGAFEIPLACQKMAQMKKYDGLIVLGCVIKGDTDHYYYISGESIRGVMEVMLKEGLPIGMGIITTNNLEQAQERSGSENNKGVESAQAVLEMIENF